MIFNFMFFVLIMLPTMILFFLLGKYHERFEWNRLIGNKFLPPSKIKELK